MHRNVVIPDNRSLVTQTSGMAICQIGYDICEFDSLRGLGIDIFGKVHFDNRYRFAIWMGSIGKATELCQQTSGCWHLTFDSFLNLDVGVDTNTKFLLLRVQTTYMTQKMRWLLGDMIDHVRTYGSRVAEGLSAFNVGLVFSCLCDVLLGVTYASMLVTTQWPLKRASNHLACLGLCGMEI